MAKRRLGSSPILDTGTGRLVTGPNAGPGYDQQTAAAEAIDLPEVTEQEYHVEIYGDNEGSKAIANSREANLRADMAMNQAEADIDAAKGALEKKKAYAKAAEELEDVAKFEMISDGVNRLAALRTQYEVIKAKKMRTDLGVYEAQLRGEINKMRIDNPNFSERDAEQMYKQRMDDYTASMLDDTFWMSTDKDWLKGQFGTDASNLETQFMNGAHLRYTTEDTMKNIMSSSNNLVTMAAEKGKLPLPGDASEGLFAVLSEINKLYVDNSHLFDNPNDARIKATYQAIESWTNQMALKNPEDVEPFIAAGGQLNELMVKSGLGHKVDELRNRVRGEVNHKRITEKRASNMIANQMKLDIFKNPSAFTTERIVAAGMQPDEELEVLTFHQTQVKAVETERAKYNYQGAVKGIPFHSTNKKDNEAIANMANRVVLPNFLRNYAEQNKGQQPTFIETIMGVFSDPVMLERRIIPTETVNGVSNMLLSHDKETSDQAMQAMSFLSSKGYNTKQFSETVWNVFQLRSMLDVDSATAQKMVTARKNVTPEYAKEVQKRVDKVWFKREEKGYSGPAAEMFQDIMERGYFETDVEKDSIEQGAYTFFRDRLIYHGMNPELPERIVFENAQRDFKGEFAPSMIGGSGAPRLRRMPPELYYPNGNPEHLAEEFAFQMGAVGLNPEKYELLNAKPEVINDVPVWVVVEVGTTNPATDANGNLLVFSWDPNAYWARLQRQRALKELKKEEERKKRRHRLMDRDYLKDKAYMKR